MELRDFFKLHPEVALALSGGADSAYLMYAAKKHARRVKAYYVKSTFQPDFETRDALRLSDELDAELEILHLDVLSIEAVASNGPERCYFCKKAIFERIISAAYKDGLYAVVDGTNASDDLSDRPGIRAIRELGVLSPLRECGISKTALRTLSEAAGLFTFDKPAYACLATRISAIEPITEEKLRKTELAEDFLFSLGFRDFRVRLSEGRARLELRKSDFPRLTENRQTINNELKKYYDSVTLDLEVRNEN